MNTMPGVSATTSGCNLISNKKTYCRFMKVFQPKIFALVGVVKPVEVPLFRAVELLCRVILKTNATSKKEVALVCIYR
jgi:hypothetical protein